MKYKHVWMLNVADWLYNRYMKINSVAIRRNTDVLFPVTKVLLEMQKEAHDTTNT